MSVIIIQVGQCGNQIGFNFFSDLIKEIKRSHDSIATVIYNNFFHTKNGKDIIANAILVDMETKVIDGCFNKSKNFEFIYDKELVVQKHSGSGNNWANGFFNHGPSIENILVEKFTILLNKLFNVDSVILINSLAGGTGSGLGAYISILIKENFPELFLTTVNVWPSETGEVIVNKYNTLLSISETYKVSDSMFIIENDDIFNVCKNVMKIKKISYEHFNSIISKRMISAFLPEIKYDDSIKKSNLKDGINPSKLIKRSKIFDINGCLSSDSRYKFVKILQIPEIPEEQIKFTNNSWNALLKLANNQIDSYKSMMMILRGKSLDDLDYLESFKDSSEYSKTYSSLQHCKIVKSNNDIFSNDKHLTCLVNSNFLNNNLEDFIVKAYSMFNYKVFVHHYIKYGLENDDFINSFRTCYQIFEDYK